MNFLYRVLTGFFAVLLTMLFVLAFILAIPILALIVLAVFTFAAIAVIPLWWTGEAIIVRVAGVEKCGYFWFRKVDLEHKSVLAAKASGTAIYADYAAEGSTDVHFTTETNERE